MKNMHFISKTVIVVALLLGSMQPTWASLEITYEKLLVAAADKGDSAEVERLLAIDGINVNALYDPYCLNDPEHPDHHWCHSLSELMGTRMCCFGEIDEGAEDLDKHEHFRVTALIAASRQGHADIVTMLIDKKADVNIHEEAELPPYLKGRILLGRTALMYAVQKKHEKIVGMLLAVDGIKIDAHGNDKEERTALILAAMDNNITAVKKLVAAGANVNAQDKRGTTALITAARMGHTEIAQILLAVDGIDFNAQEKEVPFGYIAIMERSLICGNTALITAACMGHTEIAGMLLAVDGIDVNAQNEAIGCTALMGTAVYGDIQNLKNLIAKGANVNAQDKEGNTALMHLVRNHIPAIPSIKECIKILLDAGADMTMTNARGESAFDLAKECCCDEIVQCFRDHLQNIRNLVAEEWYAVPLDVLDYEIMPFLDPESKEQQPEQK